MCKTRDIIVIDSYKDNSKTLPHHSFIVIDDEDGEITGLSYDFISVVMSSFKSDKQKKKKLSYEGNYPISHNDTQTDPHNDTDGYAKANQFYYFNKSKISYKVIGTINEETYNLLLDRIDELHRIYEITDNL